MQREIAVGERREQWQPQFQSYMYSQSNSGCHFRKLKARTSLLKRFERFDERRRSSFELWALKQRSKMSPQVGLAVYTLYVLQRNK